jgi:5-formyltetrahydrofolate cyclo-ligase
MTETIVAIDPALAARRAGWRRELLARRAALNGQARAAADAVLARRLVEALRDVDGVLGFYWPIQSEFDARATVAAWLAAAATAGQRRAVLPVVEKHHAPLRFRAWTPGTRMRPAGFGTSVPDEGEWLIPTCLVIPLVGFDSDGYRLGYGGGYYDRTLGALPARPLCIGVAYACCALDSIEPQSFDTRMDRIVTDAQGPCTTP